MQVSVLVSGVRAPAILAESLHGEYGTGPGMIESRDQIPLAQAERPAAGRQLEPGEPVERPHVHGPAEREVAVQRARRALDDVESLDDLREEQVEVVVSLRVAVGGLVVRHAVDVHGDVRRVIGAEPAYREVGGESRSLPLLVRLEAGRLPEEIPG